MTNLGHVQAPIDGGITVDQYNIQPFLIGNVRANCGHEYDRVVWDTDYYAALAWADEKLTNYPCERCMNKQVKDVHDTLCAQHNQLGIAYAITKLGALLRGAPQCSPTELIAEL